MAERGRGVNSIRRPRRRPRVRSCNFRSLWWLVAREAAWVVVTGSYVGTFAAGSRRLFALPSTDQVVRRAWREIERYPGSAYYPRR